MKALTGPQPLPTLAGMGVVTVWTVARPTDYRGHVALTAARRWYVGGWSRGLIEAVDDLCGFDNYPDALPLGAVVASAVITDCVPIIEWRDAGNDVGREVNWGEGWHHPVEPEALAHGLPDHRIRVDRRDHQGWTLTEQGPEPGLNRNITDQALFGDFTPGRWALLLDDAKLTTERCPWCWGRGFRHVHTSPCPTCWGMARCEPVPARGRPGLWEWTS